MAGLWSEVATELLIRVDEDLLARLIREIAVDVNSVRKRLDQRALAYDQRGKSPRPTTEALSQTAETLIRRASRRAALGGMLTGWAGLVGVPSEVTLRMLLTVRLAQQLAVVYGHDPGTDKGRILVRRALAAAYEIELPDQQLEGTRLSDLTSIVRASSDAHTRTAWLARAAIRTTSRSVGQSLTRTLPGLGMAPGMFRSRRTIRDQGQRMHQSLVRTWDGPANTVGPIEDAIEL